MLTARAPSLSTLDIDILCLSHPRAKPTNQPNKQTNKHNRRQNLATNLHLVSRVSWQTWFLGNPGNEQKLSLPLLVPVFQEKTRPTNAFGKNRKHCMHGCKGLLIELKYKRLTKDYSVLKNGILGYWNNTLKEITWFYVFSVVEFISNHLVWEKGHLRKVGKLC